jgi:hypothetical protein
MMMMVGVIKISRKFARGSDAVQEMGGLFGLHLGGALNPHLHLPSHREIEVYHAELVYKDKYTKLK